MCGIFGFTNFKKNNLEKARAALHTLQHRGPDQWNDYYDENTYMGHQRLSILDLSEHGKQPMVSSDGNVIVTVNGEIYNFYELKQELISKYKFASTSDSEVLLYGYIEWGIDKLLEKIDGMYAFSIYNVLDETIYLVRDRVGIKPVYYSTISSQFSWSSELKALEKYHDALIQDNTALYDFLTYRYIPTPKTMYENVFKLEPAHYLKINVVNNTYSKHQYWNLQPKVKNITMTEAKTEVNRLVKRSISEQMVSDVPVGFFLSGGMDSSVVVSLAENKNDSINTFSIGFSDKNHDETHYADLIVDRYKTNHKKKILNESQVKKLFPKIRQWFDEPFGDNSCFPTYMVSAYAKKNVSVVLTGDGGDEVFGGYNWYKAFERYKNYNLKSLKFIRPFLQKVKGCNNILGKVARKAEYFLLDDLELYSKLMGGLIKEEKQYYRKLFNIKDDYDDYWYFRKYYKEDLSLFTRLQYLDFNTFLPDDVLTKVDRVSMSVSLECRVPFLSKDILEFSFSLPEDVRLYRGELKGLMKESFKNYLPDEIIYRKKKGFSIPLHTWKKSILGDVKTQQEKILKDLYEVDVEKCAAR